MFSAYRITSPYGWRVRSGKNEFHAGIDLVKGLPGEKSSLPAFVPGTVTWAKWGNTGTGYGGYGNVVAIRDKNGFTHVYGHLDSINVREGMKVEKGQIVGRQGTTGASDGVHLHFEVRREGWNTHVNPGEYLASYYRAEEANKIETCKVRWVDNTLIGEGLLFNGRTYLPVRALENEKYVVDRWDGTTKTVYLRRV